MGSTGVIDHFLEVFTRYIDSGFGLLSGEVAFIATTLIVIDVTLAALFWSWGADDDIVARLVKKTLFVGVFAYIIGNWNNLARIIFESFAGLGLKASGTSFSTADLMRPGKVAQTGLDAGRPLLDSISSLMGYWSFFENFIQIACMFLAWVLVLLAFFILAIQLFVTLIEFKLTTLAGFVLIPFGLFGKSAFMAERVLGNVISSGIKVWCSPSSSASARRYFPSSRPGSGAEPVDRRGYGDRPCSFVAARFGNFRPRHRQRHRFRRPATQRWRCGWYRPSRRRNGRTRCWRCRCRRIRRCSHGWRRRRCGSWRRCGRRRRFDRLQPWLCRSVGRGWCRFRSRWRCPRWRKCRCLSIASGRIARRRKHEVQLQRGRQGRLRGDGRLLHHGLDRR